MFSWDVSTQIYKYMNEITHLIFGEIKVITGVWIIWYPMLHKTWELVDKEFLYQQKKQQNVAFTVLCSRSAPLLWLHFLPRALDGSVCFCLSLYVVSSSSYKIASMKTWKTMEWTSQSSTKQKQKSDTHYQVDGGQLDNYFFQLSNYLWRLIFHTAASCWLNCQQLCFVQFREI